MPELCQMWERREGGTPFPLLPKPWGDPLPRPSARAGMAGMPPLAPAERDNLGVTPDPPCGFGGEGGWVGAAGDPPALAPLQSRIVPGSAGGGGAGPRASGKAGGKAGAGTCWSRLSCWWSCSSRLPVCPCSSPAARAGCIPRGRSRPALPWRGSWIPPFSFSLFQLHLGRAACRAPAIPASSCRRAGRRGPSRSGWHPAIPSLFPGPGEHDPAPRIPVLLPTSLSRCPYPCPALRIPVQPGDVSPVTTCWDVRDGWEVVVPSLSHRILPSSDPCHALLPGTRAHPGRSGCPLVLAFPGPLLHAGGSGQGGLRLWCPTGAAWGPTSASQAPAADVVLAGCCPRAAGSAPYVSMGLWGSAGGPVPIPRAPVPIPTALCSFGCGGGSCIAPNLCMCPDGEQGITCSGTGRRGYAGCPSLSTPRIPRDGDGCELVGTVLNPLPSPCHKSQWMEVTTAPCHLSPALSPSLADPWSGVGSGWSRGGLSALWTPRPCSRATGNVWGVWLRPVL